MHKFWLMAALIGSQLLFTSGDIMARHFMKGQGFQLAAFLTWWFLAYNVIRIVAMFLQLYVISNMAIGHTMALFGAASIVLSNLLGFFLLSETLTVPLYIGVSLAVLAFLILALA